MLEILKGNIDIIKVRVILLLEANFNDLTKIFFNFRVTPSLENYSFIPYKIIRGRRDYLAVYIVLNKKLILGISI